MGEETRKGIKKGRIKKKEWQIKKNKCRIILPESSK
jgi:hypothetical protein